MGKSGFFSSDYDMSFYLFDFEDDKLTIWDAN